MGEESSEDEDGTPRPPKKKVTDIFTERAEKKKPEQQKSAIIPKDLSKMKGKFVKVDLPAEEPIVRRKKKPVEEEIEEITPVVEVESAPPMVEEEVLEAPPEEVELESAPPAPKDKVSDEFEEKNKKKLSSHEPYWKK